MTNKELKSKVMTLGNRLASRLGGDHRAAIVKAGGLELVVRGVSFGNRQETLCHLARYNPADVRPSGTGCSRKQWGPSGVPSHNKARGKMFNGSKHSSETRLKISEAAKHIWAQRREKKDDNGYRRPMAALVHQAIKDGAAWFLESGIGKNYCDIAGINPA
jgi:hypothetical protein